MPDKHGKYRTKIPCQNCGNLIRQDGNNSGYCIHCRYKFVPKHKRFTQDELIQHKRKTNLQWYYDNRKIEKDNMLKRYFEKEKIINNKCIDCGRSISSQGTRCLSCVAKKRWAEGSIHVLIGHNHPSWKGGICHSSGYTLIKAPDHPRADPSGYVREHILVWETANKKALPKGWIVHHLNGIKSDNRIINLAALPNKKHCHVLAAKGKRIQELEALLMGQSQLL